MSPAALERSIPCDCSVSGELPQDLVTALLVGAGREGKKPPGISHWGNHLTGATIAFIAGGWRLHSFTQQVYQLQGGWWLLNLWEFPCFSKQRVLELRVLRRVQRPIACRAKAPLELGGSPSSGVLEWGPLVVTGGGSAGALSRLWYLPLFPHQRRSLTISLSQVVAPGDWD